MQIHENLFYDTPSGLRLVADRFGAAERRTVLLAHGGGQTRYTWQACSRKLFQAGYSAISVDLRGHGESSWSPDGDYAIERFAEDLMTVADSCPEPPILVGASLGGVAGLVAQGDPTYRGRRRFAGLVLVDIAPRVNLGGVNKVLSFMRENLDNGFASVEEASDAIARYMPNRPRPKNLSGLAKNLRYKSGRYYWHWDPRFITTTSRREGRPPEEPDRLEAAARALEVPTLLIRGGKSELVDIEAAERFAEQVPQGEYVDVSDAGHMVAGDKNDAFGDAVLTFLRQHFPVEDVDRFL